MKSKITIDFEGVCATTKSTSFEPVIKVNAVNSDDTRDKLIKAFFEQLGTESNWLQVRFYPTEVGEETQIVIQPVKPEDLEKLVEDIKKRLNN